MGNAIYQGKCFRAAEGKTEAPHIFTLISKNPTEGFQPYNDIFRKRIHVNELDDYYEFDYFPIVKEQRCQIMKVMIEEKLMRIVHSGYELNKYYEPEHVFDQSDFVYVIPIEDASRFIMEVYRFEKPDYRKYIGKDTFDYTYEEFMESYRREVLERA